MSSNSSADSDLLGDLSSGQSCPAFTDLGHVSHQQHASRLQPARTASARHAAPALPVYQAIRAVAWCAGWRAANCCKGFGNNARCDEVLLATACEDAETAALCLGMTKRTFDSLCEAIYSSAWHCANTHFGHKADAQEDFDTAQSQWNLVRRSAELSEDAVKLLERLVWCSCWCTANWRSGSDIARSNLKQERRYAQALGLSKKSPWAPHVTHHRCKREIAWKQRAVNDHLFSNSQAAIAEQGGVKHPGLCVRRCAKKWMKILRSKAKVRLHLKRENNHTRFS